MATKIRGHEGKSATESTEGAEVFSFSLVFLTSKSFKASFSADFSHRPQVHFDNALL